MTDPRNIGHIDNRDVKTPEPGGSVPPLPAIGNRVLIEDKGMGTIVDITEHLVGILLDGEGCKVWYVSKLELQCGNRL